MVKKLLFYILLFIGLISYTQENRKLIYGKILADSTTTSSIHIINRTTNIGTLSNQYGEFKIAAKENDTLFFSAIHILNKEIEISKEQFEKLQLTVVLKAAVNELKEVVVNHNFTGKLAIDAASIKTQDKANKKALNLKSSEIIFDTDKAKSFRPKAESIKLTDPIPQKVGIDFIALYRFIRIKLKKNRKTKQSTKKKELNIRTHFTDVFFTKTLKIKHSDIDHFVKLCEKNGALELLKSNRNIELLELMHIQSKNFLKNANED